MHAVGRVRGREHLLHDLTRLGLWDADTKNEIVAASGSVADLDIPADLKDAGLAAIALHDVHSLRWRITKSDATVFRTTEVPAGDAKLVCS